ncbi:MAG: SIMPL domain-containing protein, partial [Asticcacaulis sp.]
ALYEQYRDKDGNRIEDRRADKINGYEVSLNLNIEVRDMAVLEKAYALVLAAGPSSTANIYFSLQPSNAQNAWLYTEAVKDARARAIASAEAAGGHLGAIKLIDPTGRACETDMLARGGNGEGDDTRANEVMVTAQRAYAPPAAMMAPPAPPPAPGTADYLEAQALKNPFIQTPPLERLEAKACVVYGLQ